MRVTEWMSESVGEKKYGSNYWKKEYVMKMYEVAACKIILFPAA